MNFVQNSSSHEIEEKSAEQQMNPAASHMKVHIYSSQDCPMIKNHTATLYKKMLYIFGGYDGKKNHNMLYTFDLETKEWKMPKVFGIEPPGRNGHTATLVGKKYSFEN